YGSNPYVIAWQTHNEYNCPPVDECVCDNCQKQWKVWLKKRYGTIENLNDKWGSAVWSTRYNSFEDVIAPRPTPNGHSASMSTNYSLFTQDTVAGYNAMQVEILKKYVKVPITHNTNRVFHFDNETVFEPLDFVAFDDYSTEDIYQEILFMQELCRGLKPDTPFWEMETSPSSTGHLHGNKPMHRIGFVKAEAVSGFFAGSVGFSYWVFRQHRGGTEMPHGHIKTAFGKESGGCVNVLDVTNAISELNDFIVSTKPSRAKVALMYSDKARMFVNTETLGGNNYSNDIYAMYKAILKNSYYRDIVWENSDLTPYDVIIVPYVAHISDELMAKLKRSAERGATVVVGPYSGWRTADHAYYTEQAFGPMEELFGSEVEDIMPFIGQNASYSLYGMEEPLSFMGAVVTGGEGEIKGGYLNGKSLVCQNKVGKGKIVFWGSKFTQPLTEKFLDSVIGERVERPADVEEGVVYYQREGSEGEYLCFMNMVGEPKKYKINGEYQTVIGSASATEGVIEPYGYFVAKKI
ncbi:MAG: beta-galactosidase, partial [Clostridia bacterium]|nr:beta-galactosidase [Clostridia bacterium]